MTGGIRVSRGIGMIDRMVDEVTIDRDESLHPGTVVTLRHKVSRSALIASTTFGRSPTPSTIFATEQHGEPGKVTLSVMGAVDAINAGRFAADVSDAARGGTVELIIDLSAVTLLSSRGVQVLFAIRDQLRSGPHLLTLIAKSGSPAATVLDLVGLAHQADASPTAE